MPSLKSIRKRITSVKNTQKITRAMKLVAAAKLRRAQDAIVAARPYANTLDSVVSELSDSLGGNPAEVLELATTAASQRALQLLVPRKRKRVTLVVLTSDKGLAGAFNAQVIKAIEAFVDDELDDAEVVTLRVAGRKGNDFFKNRGAEIASYDPAPTSQAAQKWSQDMALRVTEDFISGKADCVYVVYNQFLSAIAQSVTIKQILPIKTSSSVDASESAIAKKDSPQGGSIDYEYEPSMEVLLSHLLPLYVQIGLYRSALESVASEFGARMTSMDNATRNAGDMIDKLTLVYNRARQAAITKELLEIISGAESLKG